MPTKRISFSNFNRKLQLSGGREQTGQGALRRASGVAPEATTSVLSRWGSTHLYDINAIQTYYWNGARYAYDGAVLYRNGVSIKAGFNGGRLSFNSGPPQPGLPDYLFILGGGATPFKIAPDGVSISNWGIVEPPNAMQANNNAPDQIVIDSFQGSVGNWTPDPNAATADDNSEFITGTGALRINPSDGPWHIINTTISPLNLGSYPNGDISLQTDVIQFWLFFKGAFNSTWLQLDFDVDDQTFKHDYYTYAIGLLSANASNPNAFVHHAVNETIDFQQTQWQLVSIPKSAFLRRGLKLQFDWSNVKGVRFSGGNFTSSMNLDNLVLTGGCAMGAGPTVGQGGVEYDYYVVNRNLTTGSQSNPNSAPIRVFNVQVNTVALSQIPFSTDPQVTARDLYRTQALILPGGGIPFYLDTIYDNTTTTYTDNTADTSFREATTPWQMSVAVPPNAVPYYIDAGNGYYFKLKTAGTTGSSPPTWKVPTSSWGPNDSFGLNETLAPMKGAGRFFECTTKGISGLVQPNWVAVAPLGTVTDGTVVWTDIGTMDVTDNTAVWTFQGINSTPVLGNDELLLDNDYPKDTYGWAWGPEAGSMFWTADSAMGQEGYVYASPPGRPESVGQTYLVSGQNDPMQAIVAWDGLMWAFSNARAFRSRGSYPAFAFPAVNDALGTRTPFTVVPIQMQGIVYWAPDGIRMLNFAGSQLIGFSELAPIFRGQPEENLPAWNEENGPVWAEQARNEIVFSDGSALTLAITYDGLPQGGISWRLPGPVLTALYYEHQTGELQASFGGKIYLFEDPTVLSDGGAAIPFEVQSPGDFPDVGAEFTTQRLYLTLNCAANGAAQILTPTLIIDGTEYTLPQITNTKRSTIELSPKIPGRFFDGIRLTGALTGRVEIFSIAADVAIGSQQ